MGADENQIDSSISRNVRPPSIAQLKLDSKYLGPAFGATGLVFYLGCMLMLATVSHDRAVVFFNSLLHGFDADPILKASVPVSEVALGLVTTFILCWLAGVLIAGIYDLGVRLGKQ